MTRSRTRIPSVVHPEPTALILLLALLPHVAGCASTRVARVDPAAATTDQLREIHGVTTVNNDEVPFVRPGEVKDETVFGNVAIASSGNRTVARPYEVPLSEVALLWLEEAKSGSGGTISPVAAGAILAAVLLTFGLLSFDLGSCCQ